jgi:hypothetical protein
MNAFKVQADEIHRNACVFGSLHPRAVTASSQAALLAVMLEEGRAERCLNEFD